MRKQQKLFSSPFRPIFRHQQSTRLKALRLRKKRKAKQARRARRHATMRRSGLVATKRPDQPSKRKLAPLATTPALRGAKVLKVEVVEKPEHGTLSADSPALFDSFEMFKESRRVRREERERSLRLSPDEIGEIWKGMSG